MSEQFDDTYYFCDKKRLVAKWSARTGVPQTELRRLLEDLIIVIFNELVEGKGIVIRGLFTIRPVSWLQKQTGKLKSNPSFIPGIRYKLEISMMDRLKEAMQVRGKVHTKVPGLTIEQISSWDDDENGSLDVYLASQEMKEHRQQNKRPRRAPGQSS